MADLTRMSVTVTCRQGGVAQTGRVTMLATADMGNSVDFVEVAKPITALLVAGVATFTNLACTDDTFVTPTGVKYQVTIWVDGVAPMVFYAALPKAMAPGPVDLAALTLTGG